MSSNDKEPSPTGDASSEGRRLVTRQSSYVLALRRARPSKRRFLWSSPSVYHFVTLAVSLAVTLKSTIPQIDNPSGVVRWTGASTWLPLLPGKPPGDPFGFQHDHPDVHHSRDGGKSSGT
jgi:membrane-associated PAP2 superfamily phosphatase